MRTDLMSLSLDDLATLSTRGDVKRAVRELEEGSVSAQLDESPDGTVTVEWSDGVVCVLPSGKPLSASSCTCPSLKVCRHRVLSVLIYQSWAQTNQPIDVAASTSVPAPENWNPSEITDVMLLEVYPKPVLARLYRQFKEGHVFELVRGTKPVSYTHLIALSAHSRSLLI